MLQRCTHDLCHEDDLHYTLYYSANFHCVKSVRVRSYSDPQFPAFGLNTERYSVSLRNQFKCGKIQTRITLNTNNFYAVFAQS